MQRGGLAAQVAESLLNAEGLLEQPPRLGRVALGTLDDRQFVQRGGLALQISRLLIQLERFAIELHGLFVLSTAPEQTGPSVELVSQRASS